MAVWRQIVATPDIHHMRVAKSGFRPTRIPIGKTTLFVKRIHNKDGGLAKVKGSFEETRSLENSGVCFARDATWRRGCCHLRSCLHPRRGTSIRSR